MCIATGRREIANEGEKEITLVTGSNNVRTQGGVVLLYNIESGQKTPFGIEDNVYVLDLWLPPSATRVF